MKRILVTAAGGAPAINFVRSLRDAADPYFLLGMDADPYTIHRAETDAKELCPKAGEADYIDYINYLVEKYQVEFIHAQPDIEVGVLSENREQLKCKTFLPKKETVRVLRNKYLSFQQWEKAGIRVPKTILVKDEQDLKLAFSEFGTSIWLREIEGAAGKGSLASPDYETALRQIEKNKSWNRITAAEKLAKKTVTWMAIYYHGELIVAQTRERLYWEHANRTQSGVTGITGTGRTLSDPVVDDIAMKSVMAVDAEPHGIFSVDMTYDADGVPNPTEINIGKFFTTHYFFTKAGINFPEIFVKLAFDEAVDYKGVINPLPGGLNWIRGMDVEPVLVKDEEIQNLRDVFTEQRKCLKPVR